MIENADFDESTKIDLHKLRKYRNKWVHVDDPLDDEELLENPNAKERELEEMAFFAVRILRRVIYQNQLV